MAMTIEEAIRTIEVATAEVEWDYPMEYAEAFDIAIAALRKQMPRKPIEIEDINTHCYCPICRQHICINREELIEVYQHCPRCGQAIDWRSNNE